MTDGCKAKRLIQEQYTQRVSDPAPSCAPLVKWAGGKAALLPELARRLPPTFNRYYEPFAGGAALFFHLAKPGSILADLNPDLMAMYRQVALAPDEVIRHLQRKEPLHVSKAYSEWGGFYYYQRDGWNRHRGGWAPANRAATLLYLNRTAYNGLWRTNRDGAFNVPQGRYKNPKICDPQRILACSKVLAQSTIWTGDYKTTTCDARAGDLVYLDSPYPPASATAKFTGYTAGGFTEKDHAELADLALALVTRGVFVMISNADVPLVRRLYKGWKIDRVQVRRAINSKASGRGKVGEVIITGGYEIPKRGRRAAG